MYLEDVLTDEDKLNGSMLSSESTFLPFTSELDPQTAHSDSEDETETFEPDSLAPKRPAQPKKHNTQKAHQSPVDKKERCPEGKVIPGAAETAGSLAVRVTTLQSGHETSSDLSKVKIKESLQQAELDMGVSKSASMEAEKAAVKIQSWWRGQHTRCCHPMAREVRSEIRLRRMQEHIVFLSEKLDRYPNHLLVYSNFTSGL